MLNIVFPRNGSVRKIGDVLGKIEYSLKNIDELIKIHTPLEFAKSRLLRNSLILDIATIGELLKIITFNPANASVENHDPYNLISSFPEIDWQGIKGFRDIADHSYFTVDINKVWAMASKKLPVLYNAIQEIRNEYPDIASQMDKAQAIIAEFERICIAKANTLTENLEI